MSSEGLNMCRFRGRIGLATSRAQWLSSRIVGHLEPTEFYADVCPKTYAA
jgi:hypothetical protein